MKHLWLTAIQAQQITEHARKGSPAEVCGVIAGYGDKVVRIMPLPNVAKEPRRHYQIDPAGLVAAWSEIESAGLSLIGFYHSHPYGDPIPSPTDVRDAAYSDAVYLIAGLPGGSARLAAWQIRYGQVEPVELRIGVPSPENTPESPISQTQKFAIIASALLAFIFMLILALSLLPPAPIIMR
jgi:desampylase